ncbi:MAG TPA: flagellar basal body P-ring formation chaperone FlgA [Rhizomicrobium sp.]|jgi:flagella basal body P-ring formation protein FlgA
MRAVTGILGFCSVLFASAAAFAQGQVSASQRIVVPAHDIMRGQIIADSDLTYVDVPSGSILIPVVTSMNVLSGHEARRLLRANETVRADDVRMPILVARGSTVTMTFEAPGIVLTAVGKAMGEGGLGESVVVQNPNSFRQVSAIVVGAGQVRAAPAVQMPAGQIASTQITKQETTSP